jgi:signal transduction histidine kinase
MFKFLLSLLLVISSSIALAQSRQVDSLLKALDTETADSNRLRIYSRIAEYYVDNNYTKAIDYYTKALETAKKIDHKLAVANSYYSIGYCYLIKGDYDKSLENYLQSVRIYEELKDSRRLTNAYLSIGNVYNQNKNDQKTDEYYAKAKKLIDISNDSSVLNSFLAERGIQFDQRKQFDSALAYLQKAHQIAVAVKDDYFIASSLSNIALTYKHQAKTDLALQYFDSVLIMFKAMDAPLDNFAATYNNIAATYAQARNYAKAKEAFDKSIAFAKETGGRNVELENYRNLSDMYGDMKNYEQQNIFLKKYYNLKDSLFTADNKNQLTQLEADYHLEQKNGEIVKKDIEVQKQKSERNVFIIIALAAALLLSTLAIFYSRIRKKNKLLEEKNIQINQQKDELQTLNNVKDRLFSIISHDLRNPLVTLRTYLSLADNDALPAEKKQQFKTQTMQAVLQTSDMLDNLLAWANLQIKNTKANITPVNVNDAVQDAINIVQAQAQQKNIAIQKDIQAAVVLADEHILAIALRNILTNAVKYSNEGQHIFITSLKENEQVSLSVTDEGVGMTAEQLQQLQQSESESTKGTQGEKGSGLGIFLVKELLTKTYGHLIIKSEKDKGSSFIINLPALQ